MSEAFIVAAARTPVGRRNGILSSVHPIRLASTVIGEVVRRANIDPKDVDRVILGCVDQAGEQSINVARNALLSAGFPDSVPGISLDMQCGSAQEAVNVAAGFVKGGFCDLIIAGGVESMSRVPMYINRDNGPGSPYIDEMLDRGYEPDQGQAAEKLAEKWGISRQEADEFSLRSHERAAKARDAGYFDAEIVQIDVDTEGGRMTVRQDEGIRADTSLEKMASLKTVFREDGIVTAGNSSQISDGAAVLLVASQEAVERYGLKPMARIVDQVVVGSDPGLMLTGPIDATPRILERTGLKLDQIDRIEINEAFATVPLAWQREVHPDMERINVNGGAIALGHPLGATGARLMTSLVYELQRSGARTGLVTMCCGGGIGTATLIERA